MPSVVSYKSIICRMSCNSGALLNFLSREIVSFVNYIVLGAISLHFKSFKGRQMSIELL